MMNELLKANVFTGHPGWQAIAYRGEIASKRLRFEVTDETGPRPLYFAAVISREEKLAWQSFQDLWDHTVGIAQAGVQGFFGLDLLSLDLLTGIRNFNAHDYSRLLINHARDLDAEKKPLIRYGQTFAVLQKRAPADWGRIEVKTHVEIVDPEKVRLETFLKKLFREGGSDPRAVCLAHDLSLNPVWDLNVPVVIPCEAYGFHASVKTARKLSS
ncbi:MAG TPA: hypothetical protein PLL75_00030 [Candidatus Omnitrophota bacterium]|nr:hypothetical protein [Candidatus Omnitrophota bacterium]HPS36104.1 hypothetical protein [Candidatus Omnitrophota bacterium]